MMSKAESKESPLWFENAKPAEVAMPAGKPPSAAKPAVKLSLRDHAERINAADRLCVAVAKDAVSRAVEVGRLLTETKKEEFTDKQLSGWSEWVEENCDCGIRQAQVYMRAYETHQQAQLQKRSPSALSQVKPLMGAIAPNPPPEEPQRPPETNGQPAELEDDEVEVAPCFNSEAKWKATELAIMKEFKSWPDNYKIIFTRRFAGVHDSLASATPGWAPLRKHHMQIDRATGKIRPVAEVYTDDLEEAAGEIIRHFSGERLEELIALLQEGLSAD